jgi:G6PDH family F420-dependent oxidoreductase
MFPGRLWVALGTGEASNEHITGERWPDKPARNARLRECVEVMRALFAGDEVTHHGLVHVDRARLWTLPAEPPPLVGAAVSEATARWVAGWADGLATINQPRGMTERVVGGWREAGGRGRLVLQVHVSWAPSEEEALRIAHDQWRTNVFSPPIPWDLETAEAFDEAARHVRPEDMRDAVLVTSDIGRLAAWLHELLELGPDELYVHHVGREQRAFIEAFAAGALPQLAS